MPFIRSDRTDRRRRVMREAVAADAGVAVESVRASKRRRIRDRDEGEDSQILSKRDPGYSQAVRRACQQRLVQLIPVRRRSLMMTIAGLWTVWATLMIAHYFVYVHPIGSINTYPVAYLVHMRSTHGIAHWLGGQFWILTALASLMIFQLRKHKLDDYRAKYRVWGLLAIAALVSSLDASSSGLYLFGMSIDGWARREVGYSGWAVVLATFATLVGILGLRICSEIKTAPMSVVFWLGGLIAWAMSALIGTELMASPWDKTTTDMAVGGAWLGGILSVFLASGIYLRHIYIQAQKRFILRNGMLSQRQAWKLPRFARRDRPKTEGIEDSDNSEFEPEVSSAQEDRPEPKRRSHESRTDAAEPMKKRRWLRMPRWRSDPRLGDDYSDVAAEQRKRDEGFDEPFGKKRGWFAKKPATDKEITESERDRDAVRRQVASSHRNQDDDRDEMIPDFKEVSAQRRSWWKRTPKVQKTTNKPERIPSNKERDPTQAKRRWFQKSTKKKVDDATASGQPKVKKSWGLLKKRKPGEEQTSGTASNVTKTASDKPKRKLFGFLDSLKLKPPATVKAKSAPIPVNSSRSQGPSSSVAQRNESSRLEPSSNESRQSQNSDEDDFDDDGNRSLSKAERKRLRRQQENRRAA